MTATNSTKAAVLSRLEFDASPSDISKKRLRVRGKKVKSIEDVRHWIYELIVAAPRTPVQLQKETGFSAMHVWRYAKQLVQEGRVERDGHYYKKTGTNSAQVSLSRLDELLSKQSFSKIPMIQPLIQNMKRQDLRSRVARDEYSLLRSICMGRIVPSFKCHPTDWHAHETTIAFRDEYFKQKNVSRLPHNVRFALRAFYQLCLRYQLSEMEASQLGIDGGNDDIGKYADCKFSGKKEFEDLIEYYLKSDNLEMAAYVAFATETFGRPERVFQAKTSDFRLLREKMTRTKAGWDSDWTYDDKLVGDRRILVELFPALKEKIAVEEIELEIFEGKMHESKTDSIWPKEIRNPLAVSTIKQWTSKRADMLFKDKGEPFRQFNKRVNTALREGYRSTGMLHPYLYKRPSYALRHCGAHLWLERTAYNYDAVASMGWGDINTLKVYYGKYDPSQRKRSYKQAY